MSDIINRTWTEISLDALSYNIEQINGILSPETKLMAVVKADAYGHGVFEIAMMMLQSGADLLGVAFFDEARQLRSEGITAPIMILGYTPVEYAMQAVQFDITQTVFNFSSAKAISNAAVRLGKRAKIHVKVDTGMARVGYRYSENPEQRRMTEDEILDLERLPGLEIEGIYTHLATADERDESYTMEQYNRFCALLNALEERGMKIPVRHICNSAAALRFPFMHMDMVRIGISLYGIYPSEYAKCERVKLIPAMQFKTVVTHIKEIEKGDKVSYGSHFVAERKMKLATIPVGYADGYLRSLEGKAHVLIGGNIGSVVGTICMDQCMIDITDVNNITVEDEVVLFGESGDKKISVEEVAGWLGSIPYEALCVIGRRVPRVYIRNGEVAAVKNYLV